MPSSLARLSFFPAALIVAGFLLLSPARAATVGLDSNNITFEAPTNFTELSADEVAKKFPMRNGEIHAYGDETRDAMISYTLTHNAVTPEQLPSLRVALTNAMVRLVPNIQVVKSDLIDINGRRWVILESVTPSGIQRMHNIQIATSYRGVMLAFNFNADERVFGTVRDQLQASEQSVRIRDTADAKPNLPGATKPPTAGDEVGRGVIAMAQGNLDLAKQAFNAALALDPKNEAAKRGLDHIKELESQPATNAAPTGTHTP